MIIERPLTQSHRSSRDALNEAHHGSYASKNNGHHLNKIKLSILRNIVDYGTPQGLLLARSFGWVMTCLMVSSPVFIN